MNNVTLSIIQAAKAFDLRMSQVANEAEEQALLVEIHAYLDTLQGDDAKDAFKDHCAPCAWHLYDED